MADFPDAVAGFAEAVSNDETRLQAGLAAQKDDHFRFTPDFDTSKKRIARNLEQRAGRSAF